ncbi:hypothetical protein N9X02_10875, partial [Planktomarina temperata]|nr:hypothetical protein [Planktomarina temperata]
LAITVKNTPFHVFKPEAGSFFNLGHIQSLATGIFYRNLQDMTLDNVEPNVETFTFCSMDSIVYRLLN